MTIIIPKCVNTITLCCTINKFDIKKQHFDNTIHKRNIYIYIFIYMIKI